MNPSLISWYQRTFPFGRAVEILFRFAMFQTYNA